MARFLSDKILAAETNKHRWCYSVSPVPIGTSLFITSHIARRVLFLPSCTASPALSVPPRPLRPTTPTRTVPSRTVRIASSPALQHNPTTADIWAESLFYCAPPAHVLILEAGRPAQMRTIGRPGRRGRSNMATAPPPAAGRGVAAGSSLLAGAATASSSVHSFLATRPSVT